MEGKGKVADNAFNQAVGKVRQFAQRVGNFTESQKDYGNKVQGKVDNLARLVARLRDCKEQIRGIRQALRDCESRSSSALTEARAGADRARAEAVQAARDEERGRATDALNTAAANFDALSGALDGILASMNSIDNIDLGALEAEVNEICAEAGGSNEGKGNNNGRATIIAKAMAAEKIKDLGRLLELCKEQKHLTGQEVVQHQHAMYVLHKERGDEELHLDMGLLLEQEARIQDQVEEHLEDIVITVKRVEMQVNLVKKRKKEHVVSAAGKDVNLGYSIYKIFLIYIE